MPVLVAWRTDAHAGGGACAVMLLRVSACLKWHCAVHMEVRPSLQNHVLFNWDNDPRVRDAFLFILFMCLVFSSFPNPLLSFSCTCLKEYLNRAANKTSVIEG